MSEIRKTAKRLRALLVELLALPESPGMTDVRDAATELLRAVDGLLDDAEVEEDTTMRVGRWAP